ncbi:MAG: RNA polymerase sigma factor [Acidimicrobiales bacterium]
MSTPSGQDVERFTTLFDSCRPRVVAYARRHVERDAVEDVVAETFLIAWRRLADVPGDPLPWLLVVARNVIANHHRALARRDRLAVEVAALQRVLPAGPPAAEDMVARSDLLNALASLSGLEREALLLTGWDGLSDVQAARVCGCSPRTFRVRLHRARKRLEREVASLSDDGVPDHIVTASEHGTQPSMLDQLLKETS